MKLNTPYWAAIKDGKVKWDYDFSLCFEDKQYLLDLIQGIVANCKEWDETYCGLDAETWQKLEIKRVILKLQED